MKNTQIDRIGRFGFFLARNFLDTRKPKSKMQIKVMIFKMGR